MVLNLGDTMRISIIVAVFIGATCAAPWALSQTLPTDTEISTEAETLKESPHIPIRLGRRGLGDDRALPPIRNTQYLRKHQPTEPNWAEVNQSIGVSGLTSPDALTALAAADMENIAFLKDTGVTGKDLKTKGLAHSLEAYKSRALQTNAPVLVPLDAFSANSTNLVAGQNFFDFEAAFDEKDVTMLGVCEEAQLISNGPVQAAIARRRARDGAEGKMLETLNTPYQASSQEAGYSLNFSKFGCAYKLDCDTCETEEEMVEMAEAMGVLNAR